MPKNKAKKSTSPKILIKKTSQESKINRFFDSITKLGPISAIGVTLTIFFGSQMLVGLGAGVYFAVTKLSQADATKLLQESVVTNFVLLFFIQMIMILLLWVFLKTKKIKWSDIGVKKPNFDNILLSFPAFIIYFILIVITTKLVAVLIPSIDFSQKQQIAFEGASGLVPLTFVFLSLVVLQPIVEEILVRGFMYGGMIKKFKKITSAIVVSIIFGIAHLQLGSGATPLWNAAIDTFVLSLVLVWLREKTDNIWAGVIVHMIKNGIAFLIIFVFHLT